MVDNNGNLNVPVLIAVIAAAVVLIILVILFFVYKKRDKKEKEPVVTADYSDTKWVNALGEKDNILGVEAKGSRLIVQVKNNALIKKDDLHNLGALSIISSKDKVTIVLKEKAEFISKLLQ